MTLVKQQQVPFKKENNSYNNVNRKTVESKEVSSYQNLPDKEFLNLILSQDYESAWKRVNSTKNKNWRQLLSIAYEHSLIFKLQKSKGYLISQHYCNSEHRAKLTEIINAIIMKDQAQILLSRIDRDLYDILKYGSISSSKYNSSIDAKLRIIMNDAKRKSQLETQLYQCRQLLQKNLESSRSNSRVIQQRTSKSVQSLIRELISQKEMKLITQQDKEKDDIIGVLNSYSSKKYSNNHFFYATAAIKETLQSIISEKKVQQKRNSGLNSEIKQLESRLKKQEANVGEGQMHELNKNITKLKANLDIQEQKNRNQSQNLEKQKKIISQLNEKIERLEKQEDNAKNMLLKAEHISEQSKQQELQRNKSVAVKSLQSKSTHNAQQCEAFKMSLQTKILHLENRIKQLESKQQPSSPQEKLEKIKIPRQNNFNPSNNASMLKKNSDLEQEVKKVQQEIADLKEQHQRELLQNQIVVAQLTGKIERLKGEINSLKIDKETISKRQNTFNTTRQLNRAPNSLMVPEEVSSRNLISPMKSANKAEKKIQLDLIRQKAELVDQVKHLKSQIRKLEANSLIAERDRTILELQKEIQQHQMIQKEKENTIVVHQKKLEEMRKQIEQLNESSKSSLRTIESDGQEIQRKNSEIEQLKQQIHNLEQENKNLAENCSFVKEQLETLKSDSNETVSLLHQKQELTRTCSSLKQELTQKQQSIILLNQQSKQLKGQIQSKNVLIDQQTQKIISLEKYGKDTQEISEKQQTVISEQTNSIISLKLENREFSQYNFSLKSKINQLSLTNSDLEAKLRGEKHDYTPFLGGFFFDNHTFEKDYVLNLIESRTKKSLIKSKLLYRFDPLTNINFHHYIDGFKNLLLVVKLENSTILSAFSSAPLIKGESSKGGYGLIANATKNCYFEINKQNPKSKPLQYDDYYFIVGNSELRLKTQDTIIFSNFGIVNNFYETKNEKVDVLLGKGKEREVSLINYEFYQLEFNS